MVSNCAICSCNKKKKKYASVIMMHISKILTPSVAKI